MPLDGIVEDVEIRTLCLRAAELLEQTGWCQQAAGTRDGRICMAQALSLARTKGDAFDIFQLTRSLGFKEPCDIIRWNDTRGRTKEQVIARLKGENHHAA